MFPLLTPLSFLVFPGEPPAIHSGTRRDRKGLIPPATSILSQESLLLMEQQLAKVLRAWEWGAHHTQTQASPLGAYSL